MTEEPTYIRVQGFDNLYRDARSGAIVNVNQDLYTNAVEAALKRKQRDQLMGSLQNDVSELKSDMSTIKNLLLQLVGDKHDS
jgi:hypothetical protein